jgi:hypothetical protein
VHRRPKLFSLINDFLARMGKPPAFSLFGRITAEPEIQWRFCRISDATIKDTKNRPDHHSAVNGDKDEVLKMNEDFVPWMLSI